MEAQLLYRYLEDISRAVNAKLLYCALALSLTIPDICGAIEYPSETAANKRYRGWFNDWCGLHHSLMSAADCWALRCTYLHLAREEFEGDAAAWANLARIHFTSGQIGGGWVSRAIPSGRPQDKPAILMGGAPELSVSLPYRDEKGLVIGTVQVKNLSGAAADALTQDAQQMVADLAADAADGAFTGAAT